MMLLMSISLKVVRLAAMVCDSLSRSEIRSLILVMGTRFSLRDPGEAAETVALVVFSEDLGFDSEAGAFEGAGEAATGEGCGEAGAGLVSTGWFGAAPGSRENRGEPTAITDPSGTRCLVIFPDCPALTSELILSVSMTTTASSAPTGSPICLTH